MPNNAVLKDLAAKRTLGCIPGSIFWMFHADDRLRLVVGDLTGGIDVVPLQSLPAGGDRVKPGCFRRLG